MKRPAPLPSAYAAQAVAKTRASRLRELATPEGVNLHLDIASAGLRFTALLLDLGMILAILLVVTVIAFFTGISGGGDIVFIIWLLGFFLLRNFWFIAFELGPRAATPGKRMVGIRVVARDGGQLTVASVVARNMVREAEMFLPLTFLAGAADEGLAGAGMAAAGLLWSLGLSLFLLFNRDRMRLGDLIGGTWVVMARRGRIAADLSGAPSAGDTHAPQFSADELSVYGVFELQELERILREGNRDTETAVADTIRAKIGRPIAEDDRVFLTAYYRQLKKRMERDLLFGKRRANKYEAPQ